MNKLIAIILLSTVACFGGSKFVRGKFVSGAMPYIYVPVNPYTVGLQSYWSMNTPSYNPATPAYSATYGTGLLTLNPDIGVSFDSTYSDHWSGQSGYFGDYAGLYYQNSCVQSGSFTVNVWFKFGGSQDSTTKVFFGDGHIQMSGYDNVDYVYYWEFQTGQTGQATTVAGINQLDQGDWAMITIVTDNSTYTKFYINAFLYYTANEGAGTQSNVVSLNSEGIGNYLSTTGDRYDELAVWNRALSASEILTIYNSSPLFNLVP